MPRKAYPSPGQFATGPAFLPGKTPRLIDAVEVAKILRRVLRRHFAGQKFYVRSEHYSGGSSIDVVWTDGPTVAQVGPRLEPYFSVVTHEIKPAMKLNKKGVPGLWVMLR